MKLGSMGEIPPSTIGSFGFARRIASTPARAMAANFFQSGSSLKSQCERLFGSFHNITASTMACDFSRCCFTFSLEQPSDFQVEDVLPIARLQFAGDAYPGLRLGMIHDLKPARAQHRFRRGTVRDPPIGGIACVLVLDKERCRPARVLENVLLPEVIVVVPIGNVLGAAHHRLEDEASVG